jgi:PAS domain S-box-containing protein
VNRSALVVALSVLLLVEAVAAGLLLRMGDETSMTINVALALPAGLVFGFAGLVALARRPENRTGIYLAAVGFLWPLNVLADAGTDWVFTVGYSAGELAWVPFTALLLAYPTGRFATRLDRALPAATAALLLGSALLVLLLDAVPPHHTCTDCARSTIAVADEPGAAEAVHELYHVGVIALIALVVARLVRRWRGASPALRRLAWPVLGAALASLLAIGLVVVAEELAPGAEDALRVVFFVAFATIPLAFLFGILRVRLARSSVAEVVMALERGTPLRDALAKALGDPSVEIAYRLDPSRGLIGGDGWVDVRGHPVAGPIPTPQRAVRFIHRDAERIAALVYDASLANEPALVDAVTAAAGLALANERLQAELRAEITLTGALAATAPALLVNVDTDGRLLKLNPTGLHASGYDNADEVDGRFFWDVFIDDDEREAMIARFRAAAPDFPAGEYENTFTNARGERLVIYWRTAPVLDEAGRVVSIVAGGLDITGRKLREEEIRASEERLRAVIESAPVAIIEIDLEGRVLQWNPAATRIFGWTVEEVLGQPLPIVPDEHGAEFRELLRETQSKPTVTGYETTRTRKDGTLVDVEISSAPIRDANGEIVAVTAVLSDVTERRRLELDKERERAFLNAIANNAPSLLCLVDHEGRLTERGANIAFERSLGYSPEEMGDQVFWEHFVAPEDADDVRRIIERVVDGEQLDEHDHRWLTNTGNRLLIAWTCTALPPLDDRRLFLISGVDVTERNRQEDEIRASRARLVAAEDEARRKLERNLHDGAQQRLVALSVALRLVESRMDGNREAALEQLTSAQTELAQALAELRELARGIHPAVLTERGLRPALETLAARAPLPVELAAPEERVPADVEAAAYYVTAEALTNIARYAHATSAQVTVRRDDGTLLVTISDDGVGGADPGRGSGLSGLADRVSVLDGTLAVESPPGRGTTVRAEIPLSE